MAVHKSDLHYVRRISQKLVAYVTNQEGSEDEGVA